MDALQLDTIFRVVYAYGGTMKGKIIYIEDPDGFIAEWDLNKTKKSFQEVLQELAKLYVKTLF